MGNKTLDQQRVQKSIKNAYDKKQKWLKLGALQFFSSDNPAYIWEQVLLKKNWTKLQALDLSICKFQPQNLKVLIELQWPRLKYLKIKRNYVGNSGIAYLIKSSMPVLQGIQINFCTVGDQGLKHLTKGRWPLLNSLCIYTKFSCLNGCQLIYGNWRELKNVVLSKSWPNNQQGLYIVNLTLIFGIQKLMDIDICIDNKVLKEKIDGVVEKKRNPQKTLL